MPRERISMSPGEIRTFAETQRRAVLATIGAEGPWGEVVRCISRDGKLVFAVTKDCRSHGNIDRDNRVCCILEHSSAYYEIRGAMAHGAACPLHGAAGAAARAALQAWAGSGAAPEDETLFEIGLDDVASFDFGKIRSRLPD